MAQNLMYYKGGIEVLKNKWTPPSKKPEGRLKHRFLNVKNNKRCMYIFSGKWGIPEIYKPQRI